MKRLQLLGLPKSGKSRVMAALWSQGMYGAEVNSCRKLYCVSCAVLGGPHSAKALAKGVQQNLSFPWLVRPPRILKSWL
eukprot:1254952-Amphidinium_carterae.1